LNRESSDDTTQMTSDLPYPRSSANKVTNAPASVRTSVQVPPLWGWDPAALLLITVI